MTTPKADKTQTPRTDRKVLEISPANGIYPTAFYNQAGYTEYPNGIVDVDEMRQLERELTIAQSQIAAFDRQLFIQTEAAKCLGRVVADKDVQLAALEAKRREDVRKCEDIAGHTIFCIDATKQIRTTFPECFK